MMTSYKRNISLIGLVVIGLLLLMTVQPALAGGGPKVKHNTRVNPHVPRIPQGGGGSCGQGSGYVGPASTPEDGDTDGLLDSWEMNWFGDLSACPSDDPDNDTMNNYWEMVYDTDPLDIDGDHDTLWDWWEIYWFGDLSYTGTDNPDNDNCNNYEEMITGSSPVMYGCS